MHPVVEHAVLWLLVSSLATAHTQAVSISKCCPSDQLLDKSLQNCVPYGASTVAGFSGPHPSIQWTDMNITVYDPGTLQPEDVLGGPEFNMRRSCVWKDTFFFPTRTRGVYIQLSNGSLMLNTSSSSGVDTISLDPEEYCVDRVDVTVDKYPEGTFVYLTCPCRKVLCLRKCCSRAKMFVLKEWRKSVSPECTAKDPRPWTPSFEDGAPSYLLLAGRFPSCREGHNEVLLNDARDANLSFRIFSNGSAGMDQWGAGVPYAADDYCAERTTLDGGRVVENVLFCHKVRAGGELTTRASLYGAFYVVGSVFLALTLLAYGLLPDLRRSFHARALMSHVAAMLVASVFLVVGHLRASLPVDACYVVAFVIQFAFLAALFWLNVMCIDIASAFRMLQGSRRQRDAKKYLLYSIYAWGGPAVISVVTAILEFEESVPNNIIKPDFGTRSCWFSSIPATWAYFYGPMAALLVINLLLFLFTAYHILRIQCQTSILNNSESGRHDSSSRDTKRLLLYLKLFCLMGVTWIMEIVSWAHGVDEYYYVTDIVNLLRGVFIFIILCCKRKVLWLLRDKAAGNACLSRLLGSKQSRSGEANRKDSSSTQLTVDGVSVESKTPAGRNDLPMVQRPSVARNGVSSTAVVSPEADPELARTEEKRSEDVASNL